MSIYPSRLTAKQKQVLQQIQHMIERNGAPPTRAELAKALNFASVNAAETHVRALERKGMLVLKAGSARGIRLSEQALRMFASVQTPQNLTVWDTNTDLRQSLLPLNLPLIGRVAAGSPILAQEHVEDTYTVPPTLFLEKPDYLLMVRGVSMIDAGIFEGDLLAVRTRKALGDIKDGQIVVARINDEVTVKRLRLRRGRIELHPENPNYRVITVSKADEERFAIEGIVVGLIRQRLPA